MREHLGWDAERPTRSFASPMPIAGLSGGFDALYAAYAHIVASCSENEQDQLFNRTTAAWFTAPYPSTKEHEQ